jgi:hypothetical protein
MATLLAQPRVELVTAPYCPRCRHCRGPEATPAAKIVSGRSGPEAAPRLAAAWDATLHRLDDTWQARKLVAVDVADATGCAVSTAANLVRAAVVEGLLDHEYRRDDDLRVRSYVRLPQHPSQKANR